MIGRTIAHYRIIEQLGAGGMGEVFKAEDLSLGRLVALKFLPPSMAGDRQAVERLRREARTASVLNHPGICTIHAIEEVDGQQFIAMELLDGGPLSNLIAAGPVPIATLLPLAIQIADALDTAHRHGIVHRDIKPANIFVTARQQAKILDFGLVKVTSAPAAADGGADDLTIGVDMLATTPGLTVGTIAYMSPEQARGEALDPRSDLFSFGLVLYEMATGRRAFAGTTTAVVFDAILNRMPAPAIDLSPSIPAELDRIIAKAVEKEPELRYQTALDIATDLRRLKRASESGRVTASGSVSGFATVPASGSASSMTAAAPAAGTVAPTIAASTPSTTVVVAGGLSGLSKSLVAGGVFVIILLIATIGYLGGRIQERGAALLSPAANADAAAPAAETSAPASPASTDVPVAGGAQSRPETAVAAVVPAGAATNIPVPDDRAAARAEAEAIEAELEDIRGKVATRQHPQAIVAARAFIEAHPAHRLTPDAYMLLADTYGASDRRDEAIAAYAAIAEKFKTSPRAPEALFRQGQLVLQSRQAQKEQAAREIYTRVASDFPKSDWAAQALLARAQIEERIRDRIMDTAVGTYVPMALPTYRTVAERYPARSEDALWRMSEIFEDLNRYPLQAQALADLVARFPRTPHDAYWKLGEVRERRLRDIAGAIEAYASVPASSSKSRNAQKKVEELRRR